MNLDDDGPDARELYVEWMRRRRRCIACGGRTDVDPRDPDACDCEREGERDDD